jgi:hypothetical protein
MILAITWPMLGLAAWITAGWAIGRRLLSTESWGTDLGELAALGFLTVAFLMFWPVILAIAGLGLLMRSTFR